MDDLTKKAWREYYDFIDKSLKYLERVLHMEEPMSDAKPDEKPGPTVEDRELKVMESRVRAAMEKYPQEKEILEELFYPKPKEEWEDISMGCTLERYESGPQGLLIREERGGWGFWVKSIENPHPDKFKFENGRIWKLTK